MTLAEKLDALRESSAKRVPAEKRAVMHHATEALRASGALDRVAKAGDCLPPSRSPTHMMSRYARPSF